MRARVVELLDAGRELPRWCTVVATAGGIVALGLVSLVGGAPAAVAFLLFLGVATFIAVRVAEPGDRVVLLAVVVLAFIGRALVATLLEGYFQLTAPGSVFAPDELLYITTARALAE